MIDGRLSRTIRAAYPILWLFCTRCSGPDSAADESLGPSSSGDDVAQTSAALFFQDGAATWPVPPTIPVCLTSQFSATQRARIRDLVKTRWERVALAPFSGFGTCPATPPNASIAMRVGPGTPGSSRVGYPGTGSFIDMRFDSVEPEGKTVVHEIGHALGFSHEHNDPAPPCTQRTSGGNQLGTDPDLARSIMSQATCNGNSSNLSAWDVVGVQNLYRRNVAALVGSSGMCPSFSAIGGPDADVKTADCAGVRTVSYDVTGHLWSTGGVFGNPAQTVWNVGAMLAGATVRMDPATTPPSALQRWRMNSMQIRGVGEMCVRVPGALGNGVRPQLSTCVPPGDRWGLSPGGSISIANFCWDVPNGATTPGTPIDLHTCSESASQVFSLSLKGEIKFGGMCVSVAGSKPTSGALLELRSCKGETDTTRQSQRFHLTGQIEIGNGLCLTTTPTGTPMQVILCSASGTGKQFDYWPGISCPHSLCSTGGPINPDTVGTCDFCLPKICAADIFCCTEGWDARCVSEVATVCGGSCGCSHDLCVQGPALSSWCSSCAAKICAQDGFCCGVAQGTWDSICISEVATICGGTCP